MKASCKLKMEAVKGATFHKQMVEEAFNSFLTLDTGFTVVTKEGASLILNQKLFLIYSPFLRDLISTLPALSPVLLFLPTASIDALLSLQSLLSEGKSASRRRTGVQELQGLADQLGIMLEGLVVVNSESSEAELVIQPPNLLRNGEQAQNNRICIGNTFI